MSKISIIIPMFRVEQYIEHCLQSLYSQPEIALTELILVDDGSPDLSANTAQAWLQAQPLHNWRIIRQENTGPGGARNRGLDAAQGEYIWFVDADDFVAPGALSWIMSQLNENPDIVTFGSANVAGDQPDNSNPVLIYDGLPRIITGKEWLRSFKFRQCNPFTVTRRALFNDHALRYKEHLYHEDSELIPQMIYYANKVIVDNNIRYYVRYNPHSITRSRNFQKNFDNITVAQMLDNFTQRINLEPDLRPTFSHIIATLINNALYGSNLMTPTMRRNFKAHLLAHRSLLRHFSSSTVPKHKVQGLIYRPIPQLILPLHSLLTRILK